MIIDDSYLIPHPFCPLHFTGTDCTFISNYSSVGGRKEKVLFDNDCTLIWGPGNINIDPGFAESGYWVDANDPNVAVVLGTPYGERKMKRTGLFPILEGTY